MKEYTYYVVFYYKRRANTGIATTIYLNHKPINNYTEINNACEFLKHLTKSDDVTLISWRRIKNFAREEATQNEN